MSSKVDPLVLFNLPDSERHSLMVKVTNPSTNPLRKTSTAASSQPRASRFSNSDKLREATKAKAELKDLLETDRLSFVCGGSMAMLQAAHVLNAKRLKSGSTDEQKEKYRRLVDAIDERLTSFNFNLWGQFKLEGMHNKILLKSDEHVAWDLYGLFALTPSLETLVEIKRNLVQANNIWTQTRSPTRNLEGVLGTNLRNITKSVRWIVLLLRPWYFLPPTSELWMSVDRDIHGQRTGIEGMHVHTHPTDRHYPYFLDSNELPLLSGHIVETLRPDHGRLSLFAMVVNAYSKVRAAIARGNVQADVVNYYRELEAVVELIMFLPPSPSNHGNASMEVDKTPHSSPTTATFTSQSRSTRGEAAGHVSPRAPSFALPSPHENIGPGFGPLAEAPEPVLFNNLTANEADALLAQTGDSRFPSSQRVQSMMLLLFGPAGQDEASDDSDGVDIDSEYEPDD